MKHFLRTLLVMGGFALLCLGNPKELRAEQAAPMLEVQYSTSLGNSFSYGTDDSYESAGVLAKEEVLQITAREPMQGVYIKWNRVPGEWTLIADGKEIKCGKEGFLHEYVELSGKPTEVQIKADHEVTVCDIDVYGEGELPASVQRWEPSCEKADFLVFATHADDEILFLGGVLATYAGGRQLSVQVAYMCEFFSTTPVREHEKLDGIWHCGVRNYPVCGNFEDLYSRTLEKALEQYNYDDLVKYATECIRRFQPLVVVSQDFNGEYKHGGHMIYANAVKDALENSMKADFCADSVQTYGTYDVPKAYYHLYEENKIVLDVHQPLENLGGKDAFTICTEAYKLHESQQWCAFYVSDGVYKTDKESYKGYQYGIQDFGLFRSTVGNDVQCNDMMENLMSYEEIAKKEEEERLAEEKRLEEERKKQEELERQNEEASRLEENKKPLQGWQILLFILLGAVALIMLFAVLVILRYAQVQSRRKKNLKRKRKK